ncbi:carbon storage regulator [Planctomyces sp. SH-PL62]|uniref:carbon storage regulator n=1 Tax=Planctomyces sp. SH-PL62 TaxID=1636152 RepID=UPI00078B410C|nr:hypothetical protein VT85_20710 [Planctomyces sp. SH-PL62]
MLVLTRKLMERLYIGNDVCVTVVRLEGGQVRLGIEAPREVAVVRAELVPERLAETPVRRARSDEAVVDAAVRRPQVAARGSDTPRRERFQ